MCPSPAAAQDRSQNPEWGEKLPPVDNKYVSSGAIISECQRYRYVLWREWRGTHDRRNWHWFGAKDGVGHELGQPKSCLFVMLNPSTADAEVDDPTIRRCVAFAKAWKYERLEVVNLFAYRTPNPKVLLSLMHGDDPVGDRNQFHVEKSVEDAGIIICAWGAHGGHIDQDETMLGWIGRNTHALGLTSSGKPRHPLYLRSDTVPVLYAKG